MPSKLSARLAPFTTAGSASTGGTLGNRQHSHLYALVEEAYAEGKAESRADGECEAVLLVLKARALAVTGAQRKRIKACTDLRQLKKWVERAATAASTEELFD